MSNEETTNVAEQITESAPAQDQVLPEIQPAQAAPEETAQQRRFKTLRENAERAERRAAQLEEELRKRNEPEVQEDDSEIVDIKRLKRTEQSMNKKIAEQQAALDRRVAIIALKEDFPDISKVVTPENEARLREEYPHVGRILDATRDDLYNAAATAYDFIISKGIYKAEAPAPIYKDKINSNANKPRPTSSIAAQEGDTPLSRVGEAQQGLTPELKAQLYKQMKDVISRR